eukprot:1176232-Prorocentrum_minimum.AAC.7
MSQVTGRVGTPTRDVPGHLSEKRARIPPLALALLGSLPVIYFARRANLRPTTHLHAKTVYIRVRMSPRVTVGH